MARTTRQNVYRKAKKMNFINQDLIDHCELYIIVAKYIVFLNCSVHHTYLLPKGLFKNIELSQNILSSYVIWV